MFDTKNPDKNYFKIGQVAANAQLPIHVLRFWETEFARIKAIRKQFPGSRERNMVALSSVFSEEFVYLAWSPKDTLKDIIEKVKTEMEKRLNCPEEKVPFQLTPVREELKKIIESTGGEKESEVQNSDEKKLVKRRFKRK